MSRRDCSWRQSGGRAGPGVRGQESGVRSLEASRRLVIFAHIFEGAVHDTAKLLFDFVRVPAPPGGLPVLDRGRTAVVFQDAVVQPFEGAPADAHFLGALPVGIDVTDLILIVVGADHDDGVHSEGELAVDQERPGVEKSRDVVEGIVSAGDAGHAEG